VTAGSAPKVSAEQRRIGPRVAALRLFYRMAFRLLQLRALVLPRRGRGVACLLTRGVGEILLVRHTYGPRVWRLPGGSAHSGEAPATTAAREMEEELGLRNLRWRELLTIDMRLERLPVNLTCLHADLVDPKLRIDPVEIAQARWFPVQHLPTRLGPEVEQLLDLLPRTSRE
jgi:8-oxo-dGTP pyrophosphatase MutT (NUDIX family)